VKDAQAEVAPLSVQSRRLGTTLQDLVALTKPRLNVLVVATSAAGYYMGAGGTASPLPMLQAVAGTAMVAAGAATLNQLYERDTDARMRRTRLRPLPDGRVAPLDALIFGTALAVSGLATLVFTNTLASFLALTTLVVYLVVYTPLKRRSPGATLVGALPGALPPLIGWTAATGSASFGGWTLFAIVFLWQIPHFMAIAWMFRDDYRQAGFPMLPVIEPSGLRTGRQALAYSVLLLPVSLLPTAAGVSGWAYFSTALVLGLALLFLATRFARQRSDLSARALFYGSIAYLPLIWTAMILDLS
jgi:heme o synthase